MMESQICMKIVRPNFLINNTIPMTLEKLLNILCEKGWKPYEYQTIERVKMVWTLGIMFITKYNEEFSWFNIRMLTSKESWLWQFCCENEMVSAKWDGNYTYFNIHWNWKAYEHWDYEYRLIESSLKDESELESFILDNIKV